MKMAASRKWRLLRIALITALMPTWRHATEVEACDCFRLDELWAAVRQENVIGEEMQARRGNADDAQQCSTAVIFYDFSLLHSASNATGLDFLQQLRVNLTNAAPARMCGYTTYER